MRVFVLNKRGQPLMPCSPAKARLLLKEKKAIVKRRTPFTIQLTIAYDRNGRSKAACNAWRGFRLQAHWSFGHNRKGRTLRFASRTSTRHHGSFVCPSCFAPLSPQPQDALPCASFRQPCSKQAQRLACTFGGKPHCGAHVACRSGHAGLAGDCHNRRNSGV